MKICFTLWTTIHIYVIMIKIKVFGRICNYMNKKITIADIARLAGVSQSAVSIVMNNRPGVSDQTRERVMQIIKENNYTPNVNSRKLSTNKSFNIFVAVDTEYATFEDAFYNSALMGIIERCTENGYNAVLVDLTRDHTGSILLRAVNQKNVDGVIFLQSIRDVFLEVCVSAQLPFVVLDAHELIKDIPSVRCDYKKATERAVQYLLDQGHKQIALFGIGEIPAYFRETCAGYLQALSSHRLITEDAFAYSVRPTSNSVEQALDALLSYQIPDAIFCTGDLIAIYVIQHLNRRGFRVPEKISVMAMDNINASLLCTPTLTTVDIDKQKMGIEAVNLLVRLIDRDASVQFPYCQLPPGEIIIRESVIPRSGQED